jgi:hypothetical protein
MSSTHWRREEPQFYNFIALSRERLDGPRVVGGLTGALLSRDAQSDAQTYLIELPPGWRHAEDGSEASLELFVLRGDLSCGSEKVGPSGYIHLPQGCGGGEMRSEGGGIALVFWNPNLPAFPPPYTRNRVLKVTELQWRQSVPNSHGIMHKPLRLPDPHGDGYEGGPGGHLRLEYMAPGMATPFEHNHHECWEELFLLEGDIFIADEGVMGPGSAVSHPQEWWHGPFATRRGCVFIVHTDAPMGVPWGVREYPFQKEICDAYLNEADWDTPTKYAPWAELPWRRFQETPEFKAWQSTPGAEEWGSKVGRGVASAFRASWKRSVR